MVTRVLGLVCFLFISTLNLSGAKYALLIGVKDYSIAGLNSLAGPVNDVELIAKVLQDRFQFEKKNIISCINNQATHTLVKKALEKLAGKVKKGDFIYIHYSGHGSYAQDSNGDEHPRDFDQTWVTYGSRSNRVKGIDQYDILDDELFQWLTPLFKKSSYVVFVSDSCHSASITRGNAPLVRGAARDNRSYPMGQKIYRKLDFKNGIRIGAAEDDSVAYESRFEDGKTYGVFTWYWAQSLFQAQPTHTWLDIFKQTQTRVSGLYGSQVPQFQGDISQPVFGGNFKNVPPRIPVSQVSELDNKIRIEAGLLSGITVGSQYRQYKPGQRNKSSLPSAKIEVVTPFYSEALATGNFKVGDLVYEEEHVYAFKPVTVFINADDPKGEDKQVMETLRSLFPGTKNKLPGFRLARNQQESEILLYILRPKKIGNDFLKKNPADTLPQSFAGAPPEVWVLNNGEKKSFFYDIHIPFKNPSRGTELIIENLGKLTRLKELENLSSSSSINLEWQISTWEPVKKCEKSRKDCLYVESINQYFKFLESVNPEKIAVPLPLSRDTLLTFRLKNNTDMGYYTYILDIMMDGQVIPLFPSLSDNQQAALLPAKKSIDIADKMALLLDTPGRETVKLIISEAPIDISLLKQDIFRQKGGEFQKINALERLLTNAAHGINKGSTVRVNNSQWGTKQFSVLIKDHGSLIGGGPIVTGQEGIKTFQIESQLEMFIKILDRELLARGARIPAAKRFEFTDSEGTPERNAIMKQVKELYDTAAPSSLNKMFTNIDTWELIKKMIFKLKQIAQQKGIWEKDNRQDFLHIKNPKIRQNTGCVAVGCLKDCLIDSQKGFFTLKVKNFGETFNLCNEEPFREQPVLASYFFTGFLVKENVVATAGHCVDENNVNNLRFFFGYKLSNSLSKVISVPKENIYKGEKILRRMVDPKTGEDWALVKMDRKVKGQPTAKLSKNTICPNQSIYVLGYPLGLPMKYAPGSTVHAVYEKYFSADLDVYSGNSGSPVFNSDTHEVIGIVVRGDGRDFRWTGKGWISVIYSNPDKLHREPQCTRVSQFIDIIDKPNVR